MGPAGKLAQAIEIFLVGLTGEGRIAPLQQQRAQALAVLVLADQVAHVFARRAVAARRDLFIDEGFHHVRQGNVHRAHGARIRFLTKIGNGTVILAHPTDRLAARPGYGI